MQADVGIASARPLVLSPFIAAALALLLYAVVRILPGQGRLGLLHGLSSGSISFARGLNDAPKMVGVGAAFIATAGAQPPLWMFLAVAVAMSAGSWAAGRRVTETLAERVTRISDSEGLAANAANAANAATAMLVGLASQWGLPVSTTHVASMAIAGVGVRRGMRSLRWRMLGQIAFAWVVTVPVVALLTLALSIGLGR